MIKDMKIGDFLDTLAAKTSTPGGGSVAALSGAMGAALLSMVANFTIDKKGYEHLQDQFHKLLADSERLRASLTDAMKQDVDVFDAVMQSYRLPNATDSERAARQEAIQTALKEATSVPLQCIGLCREVIELSKQAVAGNRNVISDAGVAMLVAYAGLRSAVLNVYININQIKDRDFVDTSMQQMAPLLEGLEELKEELFVLVKDQL